MPDERHEQENIVRQLRDRVKECEEERARLAADAERDRSGMRAEIRMLTARIADILALLEAQQDAADLAAAQGRAEGWRAGYDQRATEEQPAEEPPDEPPQRGRHLRVVGAAVPACAAAARVLRHKAALASASVATAGLVAVAAMPWQTAEFRSHVPGPGPSVAARAYTPPGQVPGSPPGQSRSAPPGKRRGNGNGHGNGGGQPPPGAAAAPGPSPRDTPPPSPEPSATQPDADTTTPPSPRDTPPSGSAAACTPAPA